MMLTIYCALAFAALLFLLCPTRRLNAPLRYLVAVLALAFTQLPLEGVSLSGHWRATVGEPAITTTLLLLSLSWRRLRRTPPTLLPELRGYLLAIGGFALLFYPVTMGAAPFDPYRLGYQPHLLLSVVLVLSLLAWYWRHFAAATALALATLAFAFNLLTSNNYWDYLLDPLLAVLGFGMLIKTIGCQLWRRYRKPASS